MPALPPLILVSASPRRAELLRGAGQEFRVAPVDGDERWHPGEAPAAYMALGALRAGQCAEVHRQGT